tara:strand:+ start:1790 stop:2677 length:888 start_codon:yes stop_codon:yes gene_type:complete
MENKYPVYIPSKNRIENNLTAKSFIEDNLDFKIVVEPQEYNAYCKAFTKERILCLPKNDQGLIYSRLWIREHSIKNGHKRHWQFDDNIRNIGRFHKGKRIPCNAKIGIKVVEDFTDRYKNIALSGFNYDTFVRPEVKKPYYLNTHCYSAFLLDNTLEYKWRLEWNDDVDICLQIVDSGYHCTVQFNTFYANKSATMTVKGGLTTQYKIKDTRYKGACMLRDQWPNYVKVVRKFGRAHFSIKDNWRCFTHPLIRRTDIDWEKIKNIKYDNINLTKIKSIKSERLKKWYNKNRYENG